MLGLKLEPIVITPGTMFRALEFEVNLTSQNICNDDAIASIPMRKTIAPIGRHAKLPLVVN